MSLTSLFDKLEKIIREVKEANLDALSYEKYSVLLFNKGDELAQVKRSC
jgi:hypothetical protein